jgi:hypothetical protein
MRFGNYSFSYNGCGMVAIYNAMYLLEKSEPLWLIINEFDLNFGASIAYGTFGSDPLSFGNYFSYHGIKNYKQTSNFNTFNSWAKAGGIYIMVFWNSSNTVLGHKIPNPFDGAHYVAVNCIGKGQFVAYNLDGALGGTPMPSFGSIIGQGSFLYGYCLN